MRWILVAAAVSIVLGACSPATPNHRAASVPLASLQYRSDGHLVMAPVNIGAEPFWFTLDSGASHSVIDTRLAEALHLAVTRQGSTTGTGEGEVAMAHAPPMTLGMAGLALNIQDPWVIDLSGVPINQEVRGLIGAELFKNYIVRLDPDRSRLEVFDASGAFSDPDAAIIPLIVDGDRMFVEADLDVRPGLRVRSRLRVDTGSEEFVNDPHAAQSGEVRRSTLGNGLGANFEGVSGVFDAVHLGPYTFRHAWGPGGPRPSVGMEMLRRFVVTFDAPHGRIYLRPARAFNEPVPPPAS